MTPLARSALWGSARERPATARLHPPGARPTGAVRTALPVIYQLRLVAGPQALAPKAAVVCASDPERLEWSSAMVHNAPTRPPWLLAKALQANGF
jgi:hypothetical protein